MAVVLKDGSVFFHIPKTGGSWVAKVLAEQALVARQIGHKHCDIEHFANAELLRSPVAHVAYLLRRKLDRKRRRVARAPFMFTFVRHPLAWYESWWKYQTFRRGWRSWGEMLDPLNWHPMSVLNGTGSPDFNQFIRNVINRRPGFVSELYSLYTRPGHIGFVGKQERLRDDLVELLQLLGLPFDKDRLLSMGHENVSAPSEFEIAWDPDLREEVLRLEYPAIKAFGYDVSR